MNSKFFFYFSFVIRLQRRTNVSLTRSFFLLRFAFNKASFSRLLPFLFFASFFCLPGEMLHVNMKRYFKIIYFYTENARFPSVQISSLRFICLFGLVWFGTFFWLSCSSFLLNFWKIMKCSLVFHFAFLDSLILLSTKRYNGYGVGDKTTTTTMTTTNVQ